MCPSPFPLCLQQLLTLHSQARYETIVRAIEIHDNTQESNATLARLQQGIAEEESTLDKLRGQLEEAEQIAQSCDEEEQKQARGLEALRQFSAALANIPSIGET